MDLPTATTTQLLDALGTPGNQEVWEAFDRRYRPILQAVTRRAGLTAEEAIDAAQETLLEFWRDFRGGRYERGRGRLRTWIMKIAHNRAIDAVRARRRDRVVAGDTAVEVSEQAPDLQAWDEERERAIFVEAMRILRQETFVSPANLRAFEMTAIGGMAPEAAAQETGLSIDQVYVARSRVSRRLREVVETLTRAFDEDA